MAAMKVSSTPATSSADEENSHTHRSVLDVVDRSIRDSCVNAVSVSVMMLSREENLRLVNVVVEACKPLKQWEGQANARNRSAQECHDWAIDQAAGAFMQHLNLTAKVLKSPTVMESCGFKINPHVPPPQEHHVTMSMEREFADMLGQAVSTLLALRLKRGLWYMSGWPQSMSAALKDANWESKTLARFERDLANSRQLDALHAGGMMGSGLKVYQRSQFHTTAVKQYVQALSDTHGQMTSELRQVISNKISGPLQSMLIEEINGVQKNRGRSKHSTTFRRPEACFAVTLDSDIVSKKHRFKRVEPDIPVRLKTSKLPRDAFQPLPKQRSLDFSTIVSSAQATSWHSPAANDNCVKVADHQLLQDCKETYGSVCAEGLDQAWQGVLVDATHKMILAVESLDGSKKYYLGLLHFESSACATWPVSQRALPGHEGEEIFILAEELQEPVLISIFDMTASRIQACSFEWKSWYMQYHEYPGSRHILGVTPSVRPFKVGPWRSLSELAAHHGFWQLGRTVVEDIAMFHGIPVRKGDSMFQLLFSVTSKLSKLPDADVLQLLYHRMVGMEKKNAFGAEVLALDEAMETLDESDQRLVIQEQKDIKTRQEHNEMFKSEYKAKAKHILRATANAKPPARKKSKKMPSSFKMTYDEAFDISQPEAKAWLPPNSSIWRAVTGKSGWHGHHPPNPRVGCLFDDGIETRRGALHSVLVQLWDQYLTRMGMDWSQCPHDFEL